MEYKLYKLPEGFVPFEESLELKELGFDEPCLAFWDAYNGMSHLFFKKRAKAHWLVRLFSKEDEGVISYNQDSLEYFENGFCLAPTFSQAFAWFRENHSLNYKIFRDGGWWIAVVNSFKDEDYSSPEDKKNTYDLGVFDTYPEAELACLRKLIQIVKENK